MIAEPFLEKKTERIVLDIEEKIKEESAAFIS